MSAANPIMAQGAVFANLPLIDRFDADITSVINTGEREAVDLGSASLKML